MRKYNVKLQGGWNWLSEVKQMIYLPPLGKLPLSVIKSHIQPNRCTHPTHNFFSKLKPSSENSDQDPHYFHQYNEFKLMMFII